MCKNENYKSRSRLDTSLGTRISKKKSIYDRSPRPKKEFKLHLKKYPIKRQKTKYELIIQDLEKIKNKVSMKNILNNFPSKTKLLQKKTKMNRYGSAKGQKGRNLSQINLIKGKVLNSNLESDRNLKDKNNSLQSEFVNKDKK
mmetsp:Transcript_6733/g.5869  ORF Transcript_6733/g.5869 Transcript_6733/m.5869 type:complete len:143 (+) Transcript_6733:392-820(+)